MDLDLDIYEKQEILGEGSFGKVFKVKDKMTGEIFAAKISLTKISKNDKQQITNIEREVNIMAQLNHPSILKFIGFNRRDLNNKSKPVIITEYCPNGTLKDILLANGMQPKN